MAISYLKDKDFLKALDNEPLKTYYVKIIVMDKEEHPIEEIQGRVTQGTININADAAMRRTANITFVAEEKNNNLSDVNNLLSLNKKVQLFVGIENKINPNYDDMIWFKQGVFVIRQPSINHSTSGVTITLNLQDKMCLLNGDCGGTLPASVTFHEYYQQLGLIDYDADKESILEPKENFIYHFISEKEEDREKYDNAVNKINELKAECNQEVERVKADSSITDEGAREREIERIEKEYAEKIKEQELIRDTVPSYYMRYTLANGWRTISEEEAKKLTTGYESIPQLVYDIIVTVVANYGGEALSKIFVNDIDLELKQLVRHVGKSTNPLYFNMRTGEYTYNSDKIRENPAEWHPFNYNEDCGYIYTNFTYPGELVTGFGDTVTTVLDNIKNKLGNYEYFYDIDGNFVFQEIRNYLNNSYDPTIATRLDVNSLIETSVKKENGLSILDKTNYFVDFHSNSKSVYTFEEGSGLVNSYSNSPNYANIKNDFHIWGDISDEGKSAYHYHLAIKNKPTKFNEYYVVFLKDDDGKYNGKIRLATDQERSSKFEVENETLRENADRQTMFADGTIEKVTFTNDSGAYVDTLNEKLVIPYSAFSYVPNDWRAELYLQGLEEQQAGLRPDIYKQELLDLFDRIYEFGYYIDEAKTEFIKEGRFKSNIVNNPNNLDYWFDYLEPSVDMMNYSVDNIGPRIYTYQNTSIDKLYDTNVPDLIIINQGAEANEQDEIRKKCEERGQSFSQVDKTVYSNIALGTHGYSACQTARELLYAYTNYNENITISCIPIYYLDVNTRITVNDMSSDIYGDFIIKTISLPLGYTGFMNITATRAQQRI